MRKTKVSLSVWLGLSALTAIAAFVVVLALNQKTPIATIPLQDADPACREAYLSLYKNDSVDIRLVFGYKDARPARLVADRYERNAILERIEKLGFERDPSDDDLFTRSLQGPDGKQKQLLLHVSSSATGPDDEMNRKDPFQEWKTQDAELEYYEGLAHADVILYNGHSRAGGGPDFSPPKLRKDEHVDYTWYEKETPGLKRTIAALKAARPGPRLLGLFSCISDKHFSKGILDANARTALLASEVLLYFSDSLDASVEALEDLVSMRCQPDFHPAGTKLMRFF
jgi:hypothetical protein